MKYASLTIFAALLSTEALVLGLDLSPPANNHPSSAPLSFKFEKFNKNTLNIPRRLRHRKRAESVGQAVENEVHRLPLLTTPNIRILKGYFDQDFLYLIKVALGTPPQPLKLQ